MSVTDLGMSALILTPICTGLWLLARHKARSLRRLGAEAATPGVALAHQQRARRWEAVGGGIIAGAIGSYAMQVLLVVVFFR